MINNTIEHLRVMNMSALAAELERQIGEAVEKAAMLEPYRKK